jgi:hypothetical protein
MRHPHGLRAASGYRAPLAATYFSSTIAAVNLNATGTGTYTGTTGTNVNGQQDTYRHGGFTGSAIFEWVVDSGFSGSSVFWGIMDITHWNNTPNYNGASGERAMMYAQNNSAYGDASGTTLVDSTGYTTAVGTGRTLGVIYNEANGRIGFYSNGTRVFVLQNTGFIGVTKYPAVGHWFFNSSGTTMRTTQSQYAPSYALP